jgi:hypothetical protein
MKSVVNNVTGMMVNDNSLSKLQITTFIGLEFDSDEEPIERQVFWSLSFDTNHQDLMEKMFESINYI